MCGRDIVVMRKGKRDLLSTLSVMNKALTYKNEEQNWRLQLSRFLTSINFSRTRTHGQGTSDFTTARFTSSFPRTVWTRMQNVRHVLFDGCPKRCLGWFCETAKPISTETPARVFCQLSLPKPLSDGSFTGKRHFFTIPGITSSKRKEYVGKKVVGFSPDEMFQVVSDVENYKTFVPFCIRSDVNRRTEDLLLGRLEIGFPPLIESYVSRVTLNRPHLVKADCRDGKLFDHLITTWRFGAGPTNGPARCTTIYFFLSFEFKSALHSQLATVFFDQLVQQMEAAFIREAERRFGAPSIRTIHLVPPRR